MDELADEYLLVCEGVDDVMISDPPVPEVECCRQPLLISWINGGVPFITSKIVILIMCLK